MTNEDSNHPTFSSKSEKGITGRKIIYDKDGKPCRACNTLLDFQLVTGKVSDSGPSTGLGKLGSSLGVLGNQTKVNGYAKEDPPDVEQLGRSSWSLLHSIAAAYPVSPNDKQRSEMKQFMTLFSHVYPCWWCAKDFEDFIKKNSPKVGSRDELGLWMCEAHNEVNEKLGKSKFDCSFWKNRWIDGWD
ncbi:LAMI_0B02718g1_1 [Lachancea mirantina]|uniref:Sulfhydryl oxidase n=1 Tax=Lachancea mirantina TaxID=1230905 RepID=A0A1G4IU44_9SACH|nr:LAMI_0B02718g1_1 [Lachancea mirantina]